MAKWKKNILIAIKLLFLIFFLYLFIISLGLLSDGFKVLSGSALNTAIDSYQFLLNMPIFGLIAGILITVLVQSSSTSTSIMVSMVGAGLLTVPQAIYMVMGANIGTSVTSTLVAFGNAGQRDEFARAMSCAVLGDAKNWLSVIVLLPIEAASGMLLRISEGITKSLSTKSTSNINKIDFFSTLTDWFEQYIISVDKSGLGDANYNKSFVKYCAERSENCTSYCALYDSSCQPGDCFVQPDNYECSWNKLSPSESFSILFGDNCIQTKKHMFMKACFRDELVGGIVVAFALFCMFLSLALIVKILKSLLGKTLAKLIHKHINRDLCHPFEPVTPWLFLLLGIVFTILVQSSSITLSTLTPLCGIGIIELDRAYSMNVGADIGTTATSVIAALASSGTGFINSLQVSLAHLFFNIFGIMLFFAIPVTRQLPISVAQFVGKRTARYRWFAVAYIVTMFLLIPIICLGLGLASEVALYVVFITVIAVIIIICIINTLQRRKPKMLPPKLRSWKWLPLPMRSLKPYDDALFSRCFCCKCCDQQEETDPSVENPAFEKEEDLTRL